MTRIAALIAGLLLFACPGVWLISVFGRGGSEALVWLGWALLAVYGSVLLGVSVARVRANRSGQPFPANEVFKAGMFGVLAGCIVFFVGGGVYGVAKYGSFDRGIGGTLWGLLAIFLGVLSALVSAGIKLFFFSLRGAPRPPRGGAAAGALAPPPGISSPLFFYY